MIGGIFLSEVNANEQVQKNSSNTSIQEEARMRGIEKVVVFIVT